VAYRLDDTELFLFGEGTNAYAYRALGCHLVRRGKTPVARFAVWAPNAAAVSVVGDFNNWDAEKNPMEKRNGTGVWECHIPGIAGGELYKYAITAQDGSVLFKADPFAFYSERPPGTASIVWDLRGYKWKDARWMKKRRDYRPYGEPVSIFEVHLGSWRGHTNYRDMAEELAEYAKYMGYTHVELMPVAEHPFDGSWGYQVTGYYSVTSRYGTPEDFMYFVDRLHQEGIGVIVDWVPAHFPKDEHGLRLFDGTPCYESANPLEAEQPQWGTLLFNYARSEVRSFLISNALFWLDVYHVDGLRADAVSCMLYRDYGKEDSSWVPNRYGGRENLDAISFLQKTGEMVFKQHPGALFCAEESTSFPLVTRPKEDGGLTFNYKWNMGWMNDMLEYMSLDPIYRKWHHDKLTFSMMYAFSENFILPLSHDEVVHGKKSLIGRMPGDYWQQFANLRVLFCFMFGHPGKKLMFMGDEIAQFIEWRYYEPIEYKLLAFDMHKKFQSFVKALNGLYLSTPALYEIDDSWEGFQWLSVNDADRSVAAFARMGEKPDELMVCAFNFTPNPIENYRLGVPRAGIYFEALNSDDERFGGSGVVNTVPRRSERHPENGFFHSIAFRLPPLGGVFFRFSPEAGEGRVNPAQKEGASVEPIEIGSSAQLQEISAKAEGILAKDGEHQQLTPALDTEQAV
jgi:1,4-alpha-glucan branching enzyme